MQIEQGKLQIKQAELQLAQAELEIKQKEFELKVREHEDENEFKLAELNLEARSDRAVKIGN